MLLFDVTFDTGEENEIGQKHRTWLKLIVVVKYVEYTCSRGMVDKWRKISRKRIFGKKFQESMG